MATFYAHDKFFDNFYSFDDANGGKKAREALTERFSFIVSLTSDELNNSDKKSAKAWTPAFEQRAGAALIVAKEFDKVVGFIKAASDNGASGLSAYPHAKAFVESYPGIRDYVSPTI